jgi:hypothetical protein
VIAAIEDPAVIERILAHVGKFSEGVASLCTGAARSRRGRAEGGVFFQDEQRVPAEVGAVARSLALRRAAAEVGKVAGKALVVSMLKIAPQPTHAV